MELKKGDLVTHRVHGFYGIVTTHVDFMYGIKVCKVEWCESGKKHLIDISLLDKINKS